MSALNSSPVEFIRGRLYFHACGPAPRDNSTTHYFNIDNELIYEKFTYDFGPLNLAKTYRYVRMLEKKLNDPSLAGKKIVHCCRNDDNYNANSAVLIGAFMVIVKDKTAKEAFEPFLRAGCVFPGFRDATEGTPTFRLSVSDVLYGLECAIRLRWFSYGSFDLETYEHDEMLENGDMHWIIPNKILAFSGPSATGIDEDGYPTQEPHQYVPRFHSKSVGLVVRLNKAQYSPVDFEQHGIKHASLYFTDGSCPQAEIMAKFLDYARLSLEKTEGIAIHCKAGLGRTATLIALIAISAYRFPARAFIGWARLCRPGSVLGPQQQFLCEMEQNFMRLGVEEPIHIPGMEKLVLPAHIAAEYKINRPETDAIPYGGSPSRPAFGVDDGAAAPPPAIVGGLGTRSLGPAGSPVSSTSSGRRRDPSTSSPVGGIRSSSRTSSNNSGNGGGKIGMSPPNLGGGIGQQSAFGTKRVPSSVNPAAVAAASRVSPSQNPASIGYGQTRNAPSGYSAMTSIPPTTTLGSHTPTGRGVNQVSPSSAAANANVIANGSATRSSATKQLSSFWANENNKQKYSAGEAGQAEYLLQAKQRNANAGRTTTGKY